VFTNTICREWKEKGKSVPASGGEDACSADGFSPIASPYLPSVFTCLRVLFVFSAAFETEKMMKRPACWEFVLILGFRCLQGRRQWQGQYSSLCIAALLFSPSLCVLFLSLDLCFVFPLFFSPVSGFSSGFSFSSAPPCFRLSLVLCFQCSALFFALYFCSLFLLCFLGWFFSVPVLGFLLPFIDSPPDCL
jgi:hypothetical protein